MHKIICFVDHPRSNKPALQLCTVHIFNIYIYMYNTICIYNFLIQLNAVCYRQGGFEYNNFNIISSQKYICNKNNLYTINLLPKNCVWLHSREWNSTNTSYIFVNDNLRNYWNALSWYWEWYFVLPSFPMFSVFWISDYVCYNQIIFPGILLSITLF